MLRETISTALATTAATILVSAGYVGASTPWHGVVLALVSLAFGIMALAVIKED